MMVAQSLLSVTDMLMGTTGVILTREAPSPGWPGLIAIRGTQSTRDVLYDLDVRSTSWPRKSSWGQVHKGFASRTLQHLPELNETFLENHDSFVIGGHSMGGCCAILLASKLFQEGRSIREVYTFGSPKVALPEFARKYSSTKLDRITYNFVTPKDPIALRMPPIYSSVGRIVNLEYASANAWIHHDLKTYHRILHHTDAGLLLDSRSGSESMTIHSSFSEEGSSSF